MKNVGILTMIFFAHCMLLSNCAAQSQMIKQSELLAGAAAIDITPSAPVPMSGYAARGTTSTGVHDAIIMRAFVFDDGKTKACLIQADLIGFSFLFADDVAQEIEKMGILRQNCLLVASHNHGAPSTQVYGEELTDNLKAYLAELRKKVIDVVAQAMKNKVPVTVGFGKGKCTMNINRRARHAEGGIWLGRNPDGPCDHDVDVVRIENKNGNVIGMIVNWPCHATTGGQENSKITGDWPGAAARVVDREFKSVPVAITAGASADINPIYGPGNDFGEVNAIGLVVGEEIVSVAKDISSFQSGAVTVLRREIEVPGKERTASRMPNEKIVPGRPTKLRFSVLKIGSIVFAGISGELMTTIGMEIKSQSPFRNTVIVTHCNGSSGYLCTDEAYAEGGYEPMVSRTMPGVEKIIKANFLEMLNSLL